MLQKQQLDELKRRRRELAIAVHFYCSALKDMDECENDRNVLEELEEAIMSLEITDNELHYLYTVPIKEDAEAACVLTEYAVNLSWILTGTANEKEELQREVCAFKDFICSLFVKDRGEL